MALDCIACGGIVHETVVTCPHCGQPTGVAPAPPTTEQALALALAQHEHERLLTERAPTAGRLMAVTGAVDAAVLLEAIAGVIEAAAHAVTTTTRAPEPELPRAIARVRPPTIEPIASEPPEPAPPPGDHPRYLK